MYKEIIFVPPVLATFKKPGKKKFCKKYPHLCEKPVKPEPPTPTPKKVPEGGMVAGLILTIALGYTLLRK